MAGARPGPRRRSAVVVLGAAGRCARDRRRRKLGFFTIGLTQVIMLLSLGLLVRTSGQVSLCHATFAAIGAVAFSQLHGRPRASRGCSPCCSPALVVVPVGALVAIPAIRLSGLFLALATFGFGILVSRCSTPTSSCSPSLSAAAGRCRGPSIGRRDDRLLLRGAGVLGGHRR